MSSPSMASLPWPGEFGVAELDAWYEDLQDILCSDGGDWKCEQVQDPTQAEAGFLDDLESCSLAWFSGVTESQLVAELSAPIPSDVYEGADITELLDNRERDSSNSSVSDTTDQQRALPEISVTLGTKRKRESSGGAGGNKKSRKEQDLENEKVVTELMEQNERLKQEIERLTEEVRRTREALIDKLVSSRAP
ncbi:DNA damage-inducible transcript 3 protein [Erpetoichthys calabaricus]|uniref:DNA-damage-inducible transcript 3 n=1 Tax=Erpetoichthys calabaricus TaxID=27687 RepID=A0A8C4SYI5_ERPCA|nr:DNA damage-inducible transcript 3 protein [Erpetoichthys calabaricus]